MTSIDTLVPGKTMCESEASSHVTALVDENRRRNYALFAIHEAPSIERVGIVGAGVMGSLVAASAIAHGLPVVITDNNPDALQSVRQAIRSAMQAERADNSRESVEEQLSDRLLLSSDLAEVAACDLVVESIVENITTKRTFYSGLEKLCADETLIVSNTSTLPISELAAHLRAPQRFCGLHYFPPIGERKMLEIIPSSKTNAVTTAKVLRFCEQIRRIPLVVADGRGFLVNRILMAYMNAGIRLVSAGVSIEAVESLALGFGMRMGPIRLYDAVGLDVALQCGWSLSADSETFIARTPTIVRMMKKKQLGCKSGRGFFIHQAENDNERAGDINPIAQQIIDAQIESRVDLSAPEIEAAIALPMIIEATKLLEIQRAHSAWQVDLAAMCGIGFPTSCGGPLWWADQVGAVRILKALESLRELGPHLHPTQLLRDAASRHEPFYPQSGVHRSSPAANSSPATRNPS